VREDPDRGIHKLLSQGHGNWCPNREERKGVLAERTMEESEAEIRFRGRKSKTASERHTSHHTLEPREGKRKTEGAKSQEEQLDLSSHTTVKKRSRSRKGGERIQL